MGIRYPLLVLVLLAAWACVLGEFMPAASTAPARDYEADLKDLHQQLKKNYAFTELKKIDWDKIADDLLPRAAACRTDQDFGLLCLEMVARLKDSHSYVGKGTASPPQAPLPRFGHGLACLLDDKDQIVIFHVADGSPAQKAGLKPGAVITEVNGRKAEDELRDEMALLSKYYGCSSTRALRYYALRSFAFQSAREKKVALTVAEGGKSRKLELSADFEGGYVPRMPVPIDGIKDESNVSWTMLGDEVGYLRVRRIGTDLPKALDKAVTELAKARGLIIDVRGNTGGGYDNRPALGCFMNDDVEPNRPKYLGPIALLIDEGCVSAGEGWSSYFVATKRARLFGAPTTGASSRKTKIPVAGGFYQVTVSTKGYRGSLDRLIECRGLDPDEPVRVTAADLAAGKDTVLQAAKKYLLSDKAATQSATVPASMPAGESERE